MSTRPRSPRRPRPTVTVGRVNVTLFNPGPDSVVYDSAGHALDVDARVEGDRLDPVTRRCLDRGALLDVTEPTALAIEGPTQNEEA